MTNKIKDYTIPEGAKWEGALCPGAAGSKPNLTNIQAQIEENNNAMREERKARALAIPCPFCSNYHIEMQPPVKNLVGGEVTDDFKEDSPAPVREVEVKSDVVEAAIAASIGSPVPVDDAPVEDDELDLSELLSGSTEKSSSESSE